MRIKIVRMTWDNSSSDEDEYTEYSLTTSDQLNNMYLGAMPYKNPETISRELKEFWIYPSMNSPLKESQIRDMFEEDDFSPLLPLIRERLKEMIHQYVPRYMCTFFNSKMKEGELIFGLSDGGEVTGVLIDSNTEYEDVRNMVWANVEKCVKGSFGQNIYKSHRPYLNYYLEEIEKVLEVRITELSTKEDDVLIDDWHQRYIDQQRQKMHRYRREMDEYLRQKRKFLSKFEKYRRGIVTTINDPNIHDDLIDFVQTIHISNLPLTGGELSLDSPVRENIVEEIRGIGETPIEYEDGQIYDEKSDPNNLVFWITRFRDHHCKRIMKLKPSMPLLSRPCKLYKGLLQKNPVTRIARGINDDPRFKMILIQIIFPGKLSFPFPLNMPSNNMYHPSISYIDGSDGKENRKTPFRTLTKNGPACV